MRRKRLFSVTLCGRSNAAVLVLLTLLLLFGCGGAVPVPAETAIQKSEETPLVEKSIKEAYQQYFPVGAAVGPSHLSTVESIIKTHFNHLTAENDMKFGPIHPGPDNWNFTNADTIAEFARQNGMKMTGHALVWHNMQPDWLFADLLPGNPKSIETLKERLRDHVFTIVERYADVIDNWDVVNEAVSDNPDKTYRDGSEGSKWYEIFGDESYIYYAFLYAKEALEKATGTAEGKLYYNDYNEAPRKDKILALVKWLRDEKGIPVAGVGFQAHWNLETPTIDEIQSAVSLFATNGFKVKVSELDLSIYPHDDWANKVWEPAKPFDDELSKLQAERYRSLFELFRKNKEVITSVTFWGVSDEATWLDSFPMPGRNNHPLLFDDQHQPKESVKAVIDFRGPL